MKKRTKKMMVNKWRVIQRENEKNTEEKSRRSIEIEEMTIERRKLNEGRNLIKKI